MYKCEVVQTSLDINNKVDLAMIKDVSDCEMLEAVANSNDGHGDVIYPVDYALLHITNDKTANKEYDVLVVIDKSGIKYRTGSETFTRTFIDIFEDLEDEDVEWGLKVFGKDSKNFAGKKFLTCSVTRI